MSNETLFMTMLRLMKKTLVLLPGRKPEALGFNIQVDPGSPIGEYVVLIFVGRSGSLACTEKLVMQKEQGQWKFIGYFITKRKEAAAK